MQEKVGEKITEVVKDDIGGALQRFLDIGVTIGKGKDAVVLDIGLVLLIIISFIVASFLLKWIRLLFTRKMEGNDKLKFISIFKFIKYLTYIIVFITIISVAGVNITPFLAASAALLVGLGLALQDLFQDMIAGIFILVDKSLMVGDIIEIDDRVSRVTEIKLRTTRAITRDDKIIIIPNHKFISDIIYNHTQNHRSTRENVKIGVAYGSDVRLVEKLLLECVDHQKGVLKSPKPFVMFENFAESSLNFGVYFFIGDSFVDPRIKSDIRFTIDAKFKENNISIPFPQRDVHFYDNRFPLESNPKLKDE